MGTVDDVRSISRSNIVCLEGNGVRPSHRGDGWSRGGTMYTLNSTEVHAVAYQVYDARGNGDGRVSPTLTGDHQNRITDYTAIVLEIHEEDTDDSQRPRGVHNPMGRKRHIANTSKSDEAPRTDCGFAR